jgi:tetratricopeptide (TPR) repeat protein
VTALAALLVSSASPVASAECRPGDAAAFYTAARKEFTSGRFDGSVALLRLAYACDRNPVYLWNVARAYEEAHRPREALSAWEEFLAVAPGEKEQSLAKSRIAALEASLVPPKGAEPERKPAPPAAPPTKRAARAPWSIAGVGLAEVITAIVLGAIAQAKHHSAVSDPSDDRALALQRQAQTFATAANLSFVIGGVTAGAGVTWGAVDLARTRAGSVSLSASFRF